MKCLHSSSVHPQCFGSTDLFLGCLQFFSMARQRFEGGSEQLYNTLKTLLPTPRAIVSYAETSKAKRKKPLLQAQSAVLTALFKLQPTLSFRRSTFAAALLQHSQKESWLATFFHNTTKEEQLWVKVSSKRLMAMCRHASQALLQARGPSCNWIHTVLQASPGGGGGGGAASRRGASPLQEPSIALSTGCGVHIYMYLCMYVCIYISFVHIYVCMYLCMYECILGIIHAYIIDQKCKSYIYIYTYIYIHTYIYLYLYIHIHLTTFPCAKHYWKKTVEVQKHVNFLLKSFLLASSARSRSARPSGLRWPDQEGQF